jgi:two-component system sensor histidine kinase TctE
MKAPRNSTTSIRRKLLLTLFLPAAAVLIAGTVSDYLTAMSPLTDAYDQALLDSALVIAAHVREGADGRLDLVFPMDALDVLRADSRDSIYFRVSSADGTFVAGDADLPEPDTSQTNPAQMDSSYRGAPVRLVGYRTFAGNSALKVTMAETTHKRVRTRDRILTTSVAKDLVVLTVVLTLILVGSKLSLKPLRLVEDQITSRSARDLTPLSVRHVPAEIQRVVSALNHLFALVSENADRQRQFLDNAAHQLRTPLTGIQAQLELLCADEQNPVRRERLQRVLEGARRLSQTARQLLTLARADESALDSSALEAVDLTSLVESVVADALSAAERARIDLGAAIAPASIPGVGWLLAEALRSLVDNAIAHTRAGGTVTVACGAAEGAAYLEVVDDGVGIPAPERARVLERFYRASNARGTGSGLGLAIAKQVAAMHRADLAIDAGPAGHGTSVRMTFARRGAAGSRDMRDGARAAPMPS